MDMVEFRPFLECLQREFKEENIRAEEVNPISTWFSYGSNLYRPDFESKIKEYGSNLSLLCALRSTLSGYERRLDNKSSRRGLAYALHELKQTNGSESPEPVEGIIHSVPVADLPAFLRFEGVLDESYRVIKADKEEGETEKKPKRKRRYNIRRVPVIVYSKEEPTVCFGYANCFTLLGRYTVPEQSIPCQIERNYEKLVCYVLTAMNGAICFGNDITPFLEDLCKIESQLCFNKG